MSITIENKEARGIKLPPGKGSRRGMLLAPGVHVLNGEYWDFCKKNKGVQGFIAAGWIEECKKPPGPPKPPRGADKSDTPTVTSYVHDNVVEKTGMDDADLTFDSDDEHIDDGPEGVELTTEEARDAIRDCKDTVTLKDWLNREGRKTVSDLIGRRIRKLEKGFGND